MGDNLHLSPSELKFRFELRKNIPVTLSLHNPGNERVAFKVKTTSPKKYCVRPSSGYVEGGATRDVQVIMQAQREYPPSLVDCKDKFLVQSLKIGKDVTEVGAELFEQGQGKDIKQSKLRVVLVGPPKPPSPVPEGDEEDSPAKNSSFQADGNLTESDGGASLNEVSVLTRERNRLREQLAQVESDKVEIKRRLDLVEAHDSKGARQANKLSTGFTPLHILLITFLSFLIGLYIGRRVIPAC